MKTQKSFACVIGACLVWAAGSVHAQSALAAIACDGTPAAGTVNVPDDADLWAAPAGYYSGVSGTGSKLKQTLGAAMTNGHIQRSYGDFRYASPFFDADPNVPGRILLVYNRSSVSGNWDSGSTWNREHVWPQSRQPGSVSNSSRGHLGDPHALRPANPSINSSRGNKPFGFGNTTGNFGSQGSYYFPGDRDKGDIARSLFYSATRYASSGLVLTNNFPSGNQMGSLDAAMEWHFLDTPDEFERRRNHVIYSQADNPSYYTRNRNAFVDMPGAAWSVYVDDLNDSRLWVGSGPASDGSSSVDLCMRAIGEFTPPAFDVTLNRDGVDGVYYAVSSSGDAVSDQPLHNGFTGAFPIGNASSRTIRVGIDPSVVDGPGIYSGSVTVDNLDMTTGFGAGRGGNDGDDVIGVSFESLTPSLASLAPEAQVTTLDVDADLLTLGDTAEIEIPIYALDAGFPAAPVVSLVGLAGSSGIVDVVLPSTAILPGGSANLVVEVTPNEAGPLVIFVTLGTADDPTIMGAMDRGTLALTITAPVRDTRDLNGDGTVDAVDLATLLEILDVNDPFSDLSGDGAFDVFDVLAYLAQEGVQGG